MYYSIEQRLIEQDSDFLSHLFDQEKEYLIIVELKEDVEQQMITSKMRTKLLDWIIEICHHYNYHDDSLFTCVRILDMFLSKKSITANKLQLAGSACLMLALKTRESLIMSFNEMVDLADGAFNKAEVWHN